MRWGHIKPISSFVGGEVNSSWERILNPQVDSPLFVAVLLLLWPIHFRGGRPGLPAWGFKNPSLMPSLRKDIQYNSGIMNNISCWLKTQVTTSYTMCSRRTVSLGDCRWLLESPWTCTHHPWEWSRGHGFEPQSGRPWWVLSCFSRFERMTSLFDSHGLV